MTYSRHDFLRIAAAGLPVVTGVPWLFASAAHALSSTDDQYGQAQADRIHYRSTEAEIRLAGKKPEEVRAQVDRRLRELKANSAG